MANLFLFPECEYKRIKGLQDKRWRRGTSEASKWWSSWTAAEICCRGGDLYIADVAIKGEDGLFVCLFVPSMYESSLIRGAGLRWTVQTLSKFCSCMPLTAADVWNVLGQKALPGIGWMWMPSLDSHGFGNLVSIPLLLLLILFHTAFIDPLLIHEESARNPHFVSTDTC